MDKTAERREMRVRRRENKAGECEETFVSFNIPAGSSSRTKVLNFTALPRS
jgi:hypothetical protein